MGCLRMIAGASACLGIIAGVACTSSRVRVYGMVARTWLALFALLQAVTALLFHMLGTLQRSAPGLGQHDEEIIAPSSIKDGRNYLQEL